MSKSTRETVVVRDGQELIRKRKKRDRTRTIKMKKHLKRLAIPVGIILGILIILLILWLIGMFNMKMHGDDLEYNGHHYRFNENLVGVNFIGYDQREEDAASGRTGQSDYIAVLTFDTETGVIKGINIPRDTMIDSTEHVGHEYINQDQKTQIALSFADDSSVNKASETTTSAVSRLLYNMPIKQYYSLNLDGIGPINDAIGGVTLIPLETLNSSIVKDKITTLHGDNAKVYVQARSNDFDGSEKRRKRDSQYMAEFYKHGYAAVRTPQGALDLFNQGSKYSTTSIGVPEFMYLASVALTKNMNRFDLRRIEGEYKQGPKYVEFWPDQTKLFEQVLDVFYIRLD